MVKFNVTRRDPVSIGFTLRDIQSIDALLASDSIKEIGINSRAKLIVCIVYAISKKFALLSDELQKASTLANNTQPQGVILTSHQETTEIAEKISKSKTGEMLGLKSSQDMIMTVVHTLLKSVRSNHRSLYRLLDVSLADIEEAFCERYRSKSE